MSVYNTKVRHKDYISPEQLSLGQELEELLAPKNGRLLHSPLSGDDHHNQLMFTPEVSEFNQSHRSKINKLCDIYAVGAILFRLLLGAPPTSDISDYIAKKRLNDKSPSMNVYEVPFFFKDFILSNDMCYIIVKLLHQNPKYRYQSLAELRNDLLNLKENIYSMPTMLRRILGHPVLPQESQH